MDPEVFRRRIAPFRNRVVIDIGTGDGLFVYRSALRETDRFFIGVEPDVRSLEKTSVKTYRDTKESANALFVRATVDDLPQEFTAIASEARIHFPWGRLLKAVGSGEAGVLNGLRRVCEPEAKLLAVLSVDPERDYAELKRLSMPPMTAAHFDELKELYRAAGFEMRWETKPASSIPSTIETSWAGRLKHSKSRRLILLSAVAI